MLKNPTWLDAAKLAPQFYKHPAPRTPDKNVIFQTFPGPATEAQLKAAGITHVWVINRGDRAGMKPAENFSTEMFGSSNPSEATVRAAARNQQIENEKIITDEFAEGAFGQDNQHQTRIWFYSELAIMAQEQGKTIKLRGEYGSGAVSEYKEWKRVHDQPREPMSQYMLSLLTPQIVANLDNTLLKTFAQSAQAATWGRVVSYYESQERDYREVISNFPFQAMIQYNAVPNAETTLFTWPLQQSNGTMIDVPQRDAGTIRPNGQTVTHFPHRPPELAKMFAFLGLLFYEDIYHWGDNGTPPDDDNSGDLRFPAISTDAFKVGVDWYCELIPTLNSAGRELLACPYTADGVEFNLSGEKRISRLGHAYYNNAYFNLAAQQKKPWMIVIPGTNPRFIYVDPWTLPIFSKRIFAKYDNRLWDLGHIPGMTLYVS